MIGSLAETHLTDLAAGLKAIAGAADEGDAEAVMEAAHKLKSSSRLMGAPRLGDLAEVIETDGRNGEVPGVDAFGEFVGEANRVIESLPADAAERGRLDQAGIHPPAASWSFSTCRISRLRDALRQRDALHVCCPACGSKTGTVLLAAGAGKGARTYRATQPPAYPESDAR